MSETTLHTFDELTGRLDEIISTVRSKDTSLERCLELFDEAIDLGSRAVDMVDTFDFSPAEAEAIADANERDAASAAGETPDAQGGEDASSDSSIAEDAGEGDVARP